MKIRRIFLAMVSGFGLVLITYGLLALPPIINAQAYDYFVEIRPVRKNYDDGQQICTSTYTVTNENAVLASYLYTFYDDVEGGSVIYEVYGTIPASGVVTYNLADIAPIPSGYRGRVVIESDQRLTVTLSCCSDEWLGEYYGNRDLQWSPPLVRCDSQIDFLWKRGSPDTQLPVDNFSVRWSKNIDISTTGWYNFRAFTDDGVRLYVDGERIIDDWTARSFTEKSALKKLDPGRHEVTMEYVEWSNDAMAHLNWYHTLMCPIAAIDCQLNITPMYQTQYLDRPMPEGCSTVANQTIARYGCLITSYAMAIQVLGVSIDPDNLNSRLSKQPGAYPSPCDGNLQGPGFIPQVITEKDLSVVAVHTSNDAKTALRNGYPVIMRANNVKHFFLATDIAELNGQEYFGILDPHHAWACDVISAGEPPPVLSKLLCSESTTLKHTTTTQERFSNPTPILYLKPATQPQTPILQLYARGAEVLVADSQNRRTGFERATGSVVYEVPNSLYYDAEIVPPGGVSDGVIERTVFLPETPDGSYSLQIFGAVGVQAQAASDFEINIVGFDSAFDSIGTQITGTIASGGVASYEIDFDPEQGIIAVSSSNKYIYLPLIMK